MVSSLKEKTDSSAAGDSKMTSTEKVEAPSPHYTVHRNKPDFSDTKMTVVMNIKFENNGVHIMDNYHADLAKIAKFLQENSKLIVVLDVNLAAGAPSSKVEIARLRLKHIMDYLAANFRISYSRFYVAQLVRPPTYGDIFQKFVGGHDDVTITLKYPSVLS